MNVPKFPRPILKLTVTFALLLPNGIGAIGAPLHSPGLSVEPSGAALAAGLLMMFVASRRLRSYLLKKRRWGKGAAVTVRQPSRHQR